MCGVAGFFQSRKQFTEAELQVMTDVQRHRGPDADGHFTDDFCGLGHRRLSILDLSDAANQPMFSKDRKTIILFNGEVYNFREIASELKVELRTTSDTEVILEAYLRWGTAFLDKLNGMFVVAIYEVEKKQLFICRDRMGIKPLYYYYKDGAFVFSSELKGILALRPTVKLTLNRQAVKDFLLLGYVPEPISICNEVMKFPSGSYAIVNESGFEIKSWWQPEDKITGAVLKDEAVAKRKLDELVNSSVAYRMISDVPFGTFLSGGIDSSLVTAVAQKNSALPVNTFSIGFKEGKYNEAGYAAEVAKHLGTHHHEFTVTEQDAMGLIDRMIDAYDEPFADSSAIPTMLVSKLAREHVTMTLSGDGGDELFLGYGTYRWAERLSNPLIRMARKPIHALLSAAKDNRVKRAALHFAYDEPKHLRSHIFSQEIYYFSRREINKLMLNAPAGYAVNDIPGKYPRKLSASEEQAVFDIRYYLKDDLLAKVDRATMQFSLETRVPLIDYRIVEFALNLDPSLKYRNGIPKYLLKEVLYQYVPRHLFERPKWGFSIPLDKWLQTDLNYLIDKYASKEACEKFGLINFNELDLYRREFKAGKTFYYNRLWQVIVLHKFLEKSGLDS